MKATPSPSPAVKLGAALIFGAMAAAGWISGGSGTPAETSATPVPGSSNSGPRPLKRKGPPEEVTAQLAAVRNAKGEVERTRAAIALAKSIPQADIPKWLSQHWFNIRGGQEMMIFNVILRNRWQEADPAAYSAWILKTDYTEAGSAFLAWAKQDRQAFLDYIRTCKEPNAMYALGKMAEDDPQLAFAACQEMLKTSSPNEAQNWMWSVFPQLAAKNPGLIEGILDQLPDRLRKQAETILCTQRLTTSFDSEVRKLWQDPDGWKKFQDAAGRADLVGKNLLKLLGEMPDSWKRNIASGRMSIGYGNPEAWVNTDLSRYGFSAEESERLKMSALSYMYNNPQGVLDFLKKGGISEESRKMALMNLYNNVQSRDDKETYLSQFSADERAAAEEYTNKYTYRVSPNPKDRTPEKLIERVTTAEDSDQSFQHLAYDTQEWSADQWQDLSHRFKDLPADIKKKMALALSGNSYGRWDDASGAFRGDAVAYLIANPDPPPQTPSPGDGRPYRSAVNPVQLASTYAVDLGIQDPVAASDWVQKLPEGDVKLWAQKNLALNWNKYDSEAVDRWVQSMPAASRDAVKDFVSKGGGYR